MQFFAGHRGDRKRITHRGEVECIVECTNQSGGQRGLPEAASNSIKLLAHGGRMITESAQEVHMDAQTFELFVIGVLGDGMSRCGILAARHIEGWVIR